MSAATDLVRCLLCPRQCGANRRAGSTGCCGCDAGMHVASVCLHRGEEPALGPNGICNVFFHGCNMRCAYCQNHQISRGPENREPQLCSSADAVAERIASHLAGECRSVGFVSPSHQVPQMRAIAAALRARGHDPVFVMNTNSYDLPATLASVETTIGVYLADFRYADRELARTLSNTPDYPERALAALREMKRQKGVSLELDSTGLAHSGIIVRHLVLPGHAEHSIRCLRIIADELSPRIHLSLMSQYAPTPEVTGHPTLGRRLDPEEYARVKEEMERLGFANGWVQELDSPDSYQPDFSRPHPFENETGHGTCIPCPAH